jgi:hypothetical protein
MHVFKMKQEIVGQPLSLQVGIKQCAAPSGTLGLKRSWVQTQWRAGEIAAGPDLGFSPTACKSGLLMCAPKKEGKQTRVSEAPNVL